MQIHTQRGELTGKYGSLINSAGAQQDQAIIESNADAIWGHMGKNANGIRWTQGLAAGPLTGMYAIVTTADSLTNLWNQVMRCLQTLTSWGEWLKWDFS